MKKIINKIFFCATVLMLLIAMTSCGDITNQDPSVWPRLGPASQLPKPQAGEINQALTKKDVDGKAFAIITLKNFTAEDMGNYIRLLLDNGFETFESQRVAGNLITYSAKKGKLSVSLLQKTDKNEIRINVE